MKSDLVKVEERVTTEETVRLDLRGKNPLDALVTFFQRLDDGWRVDGIDIHFSRHEATYYGPPGVSGVRVRPVRRRRNAR